MFGKRNRIIYIPYEARGGKINEYTVNMIKILQKKYHVCGELAEPFDIYSMVKTKAVFLNWIEEQLNAGIKLRLCLHKLFGVKIIWVFHNKFPHQAAEDDKRVMGNMKWLANHADQIMLHSVHSENYIPNLKRNRRKKVYIPHIMYEKEKERSCEEELRKRYGISERDFVFLMFGMIKPYKHYEEGINAFKRMGVKRAKLILAGNSMDVKYTKYLERLCAGNADIVLDLRYLPTLILETLIEISDVIVIPYKNHTSMNSGVMIQAFSNEKTVIVPDICMGRDFASEGFIYGYRKSLGNAMMRAYENGKELNRKMGKQAYEYVSRYHNEAVVRKRLYQMLDKHESL